jgi:hypothetical protein
MKKTKTASATRKPKPTPLELAENAIRRLDTQDRIRVLLRLYWPCFWNEGGDHDSEPDVDLASASLPWFSACVAPHSPTLMR